MHNKKQNSQINFLGYLPSLSQDNTEANHYSVDSQCSRRLSKLNANVIKSLLDRDECSHVYYRNVNQSLVEKMPNIVQSFDSPFYHILEIDTKKIEPILTKFFIENFNFNSDIHHHLIVDIAKEVKRYSKITGDQKVQIRLIHQSWDNFKDLANVGKLDEGLVASAIRAEKHRAEIHLDEYPISFLKMYHGATTMALDVRDFSKDRMNILNDRWATVGEGERYSPDAIEEAVNKNKPQEAEELIGEYLRDLDLFQRYQIPLILGDTARVFSFEPFSTNIYLGGQAFSDKNKLYHAQPIPWGQNKEAKRFLLAVESIGVQSS